MTWEVSNGVMGTTLSWAAAVRACAISSAVITIVRGAVLVDRESIAIGVALAVATALTFTGHALVRRLGWIGAAALFVNQAFWMVGATVSLTSAAPSVLGAAVPAVLAVAAVFGLVASAARARSGTGGAAPVALGAAAVAVALSIGVPIAGADAVGAREGDLRVTTSDLAFSTERLVADAGDVGVVVKNEDLFWHTFTVNKLNANVNVPTGGTKRLVLEDLAPGTYDFVCAIPGHEGAGMKGVLVVR